MIKRINKEEISVNVKAAIPTVINLIYMIGEFLVINAYGVNNLTMNFEKGKLYAIVGENGSGKSTPAKLIAGYNPGYSGYTVRDRLRVKRM